METANKNQFDSSLIKSENFNEENQTTNTLSNYLKSFSKRPDGKDSNKNSELVSLIESSSAKWNINDSNNDISFGLKNLEFEAGLTENELEYNFIRIRSHIFYTTAIAQACYFIGIANRIRRSIEDIKNGNQILQKNSLLLNEMNKSPGLQIGILGCGKLGRQLANALLEFSKVSPNELQISTRQPETLIHLKNKNVKCFFDNRLLASSCNIIFICVLPSQLDLVINEIKKYLPDKCIIYAFVRSESSTHLRNLFGEIPSSSFIIKAQYHVNIKTNWIKSNKWNYSDNITESMNKNEVIINTNPFLFDEDSAVKTDIYFANSLIYAFLNICIFLGLNKQETLFCMKKFVFNNSIKNIKIDESLFYDITQKTTIFDIVDLIDISNDNSPLVKILRSSKHYKLSLFKNYNEYFEDSHFTNSFNNNNNQ